MYIVNILNYFLIKDRQAVINLLLGKNKVVVEVLRIYKAFNCRLFYEIKIIFTTIIFIK